MRYLKKFFESNQSDLEIIKEYFFNLTDELDNLCVVSFFENTANYYTVEIYSKSNIGGVIKQDEPESINKWIESLDVHSKILKELKVSISQLGDDSVIESYTLEKSHNSYKIQIFTKLKNQEDINNWIFLEDYTIWVDEFRLKQYMESKFNVKFDSYSLNEEHTRRGDRYIDFTVNFKEPVQVDELNKIKKDFLEIKIRFEDEDEDIGAFEECYFGSQGHPSTYVSFVVNDYVLNYR